MIRINLLGEPARLDARGTRWLVAYGASIVALCAVCLVVRYAALREESALTRETEALVSELGRLKQITQEVRTLESKRTNLRAKLDVIDTLKRNKTGPVRLLDDLNAALPDRAWLTDIAENLGSMKLVGYALDNQVIAGFMKALERSDFVETVELIEAKLMARDGVKIKMFTLDTKINYAGAKPTPFPAVTPGSAPTPLPGDPR